MSAQARLATALGVWPPKSRSKSAMPRPTSHSVAGVVGNVFAAVQRHKMAARERRPLAIRSRNRSGCGGLRGLARDVVVNVNELWLGRGNAELLHYPANDSKEAVKILSRAPYIADTKILLVTEADVEQPSDRCSLAGRLETPHDLVVLL